MTKEQKQFNDEAAHLEAANNLADVAISLYGGDAGLHLFGASLEAYTRAHGVVETLRIMEGYLQSIMDNKDKPLRLAQ